MNNIPTETENKTYQNKVMIDTKQLSDLAIYLSGMKDGKGNLLPLGTIVLEELWATIKYLQGDNRYFSERDKIKTLK